MEHNATPLCPEDDGHAFQSLSEAVLILDLQGRVMTVTQAACQALGRSELEFSGADWWSRFDARTEDGVVVGGHRSLGATVIATRQPLREQTLDVARPDGSRMWLSVDYRPLSSADGDVTGLVLSMRDITHLPGQ